MLATLSIRNLALIQDITVEWGPKFNVITGETGAGKTLLVTALTLLQGEKANADIIRTGETEAHLTAVFSFSQGSATQGSATLSGLLKECEIPENDELILKRILTREGKNRVLINGEPTTLQVLKRLGAYLFDIASQHQQQELLDPSKHLFWLDLWTKASAEQEEYKKVFTTYKEVSKNIETLKIRNQNAKAQLDFLKFQWEELKNAKLKEGEEEALQTQKERLRHKTKLQQVLQVVEEGLDSGSLVKAIQALESIQNVEPSAKNWFELLQTSRIGMEEVSREVSKYVSSLDREGDSLETVEDRLALLQQLKRKYQQDVAGLKIKQEQLKMDIDSVESFEEALRAVKEKQANTLKQLQTGFDRLQKKRKDGATTLVKQMEKELKSVAMPHAQFHVLFRALPVEEWNENGGSEISFQISPNVGEPLKGLADIASGGELSRILLVLKHLIARQTSLPATMILDEVDVGIGGDAAVAVAKKIAASAEHQQILCVTHLAPIAAAAQHHFQIQKEVEGKRTQTRLVSLSRLERVEEVTRMLAGSRESQKSRAHAEELLLQNQ